MNLLQSERPEVFKAYMQLIETLENNCAVEPRVRELVLIGILTVGGSPEGLKRHIKRAVEFGASKDEVVMAITSPLPITGVRCVMVGLQAADEILSLSQKQ